MTPFDLAQRFVGHLDERAGSRQHPFIQWCHELSGLGEDVADEVPWCSAFVNGICWLLRLPRSKSARARSWLQVGKGVAIKSEEVGFDVVILTRGPHPQPGPEIIAAPGHVGFFAGWEGSSMLVLGGNQGNNVSVEPFGQARVLGVRRLI